MYFTVKRNTLKTALLKCLKTIKCSSEKMGFEFLKILAGSYFCSAAAFMFDQNRIVNLYSVANYRLRSQN